MSYRHNECSGLSFKKLTVSQAEIFFENCHKRLLLLEWGSVLKGKTLPITATLRAHRPRLVGRDLRGQVDRPMRPYRVAASVSGFDALRFLPLGHLKSLVYRQEPRDLEDLKQKITDSWADIEQHTIDRSLVKSGNSALDIHCVCTRLPVVSYQIVNLATSLTEKSTILLILKHT